MEVRQITEVTSGRAELHVKTVLTQQDLKDIIYAAMHYTANVTPKFLRALAEDVIENWNKGEKSFVQTKAGIKANYF